MYLLESFSSKAGQHEAGTVDILVVVSAQLIFLFSCPRTDGLANVALRVLAGDEEANLAGWVGGNGGVGVFDDGEDFLHEFLEVGDELDVKPLVLGWTWKN